MAENLLLHVKYRNSRPGHRSTQIQTHMAHRRWLTQVRRVISFALGSPSVLASANNILENTTNSEELDNKDNQ